MLREAVERAGARLGVDVAALAAAVDELGPAPVDPRIGWSDASERIFAAASWPANGSIGDLAVARRISDDGNRVQRKTASALRARRGAGWVAYESVPRKVGLVATAVGLPGRCDPGTELTSLVGVSIVTAQAGARMAERWPKLGVACDLLVDRAQPPLGPNLWSFSGPVPASELAGAIARVADAMEILPGHRALADAVAATGPAVRIGLDAVFDDVHPVIWIATAPVSLDAARALVGQVLGDAARAGKVADALAAAGGLGAEVALRLASEEPVRIRVTAPLPGGN
jgi:hypothetical protein